MKHKFSMFKILSSPAEEETMFTWGYDIEEVFKFIHPNFCQSPVVLVDDMTSATRESVGSCLPKNVTNMGASHNLQRASTLPNLRKGAIDLSQSLQITQKYCLASLTKAKS